MARAVTAPLNAEIDAASRLVSACERAHVQRVLIIGGPADLRAALLALLLKLDVRAIDGTEPLTDDRADRLSQWADVVVLWGPSDLHRGVAKHFGRGGRSRAAAVITVEQAGIAGLLGETALHLPSPPPNEIA